MTINTGVSRKSDFMNPEDFLPDGTDVCMDGLEPQNEGDSQKADSEGSGEELSIEEAFEKLDGLIGRLEDREIPLEEAFALYQQGLQLIQTCGEKLDTVEKKIQVLTPDGDLEEFE
ncbi:MAG: exodeoxyribonuclease VII small subunit [Lachnospiraceae bacterium]|nr:exodeoxyribonuclease VII small subunit [Lachnospiraceae bacterium]